MFTGDAWFFAATFNAARSSRRRPSPAAFVSRGATFNGPTSFAGATFAGAVFGGAAFTGVASFVGATFAGLATFGGAEFAGDAEFGGVRVLNLDIPYWIDCGRTGGPFKSIQTTRPSAG